MGEITLWQQKLQIYRAEGVQVISCEDAEAETMLQTRGNGEPPVPISSFLRFWKQGVPDVWRALVESAVIINPEVAQELTQAGRLGSLRSLVLRTEQVALLCWPLTSWQTSRQWGYLLQIKSSQAGGQSNHLVLHPPASSQELHATEAVLRLTLPASYRRFLQLTNGLGAGIKVYGAGPLRADWKAVQLNEGLACEQFLEIAAQWRAFQGVYDYERIRDWENGENTFLSDETLLIPFGYTYETWCFDRSRPAANGEYPVIFWDHETLEATDVYPDFALWFAGEIESYLFSE